MSSDQTRLPLFPRRVLPAAALSGLLAAALVGLALLGGLNQTKSETFQFSRGLSLATGEEDRLRGALSTALADARLHAVILGHSGTTGDAEANLELSRDRAALARDLAQTLGIPPDQVTARGLGGGKPLPKSEGESERAYQTRLARVELVLQRRK